MYVRVRICEYLLVKLRGLELLHAECPPQRGKTVLHIPHVFCSLRVGYRAEKGRVEEEFDWVITGGWYI